MTLQRAATFPPWEGRLTVAGSGWDWRANPLPPRDVPTSKMPGEDHDRDLPSFAKFLVSLQLAVYRRGILASATFHVPPPYHQGS
jgi:hypothetical protein